MRRDFSVIIIHYNREANLRNTLKGLSLQSIKPSEVIIVEMGKKTQLENSYPFDIRFVEYVRDWNFLPLAQARNLGARASTFETLLFLDVDCIPSKHYCKVMVGAVGDTEGLVMASPRYLLEKTDANLSSTNLRKLSVLHPNRPVVDGLKRETCYELFWSLCFGIHKKVFDKIGGFSESYVGYGAEDTDFTLKVKRMGIPFFLSEVEVFHQQHPICIPPLNHLESIVNNCNEFFKRWGYWPMINCLVSFADMEYILWEKDQTEQIGLLRLPNKSQIRKHMVKNAPYR